MLSMAMDSAKLFFAGKLFKDLPKVIRQMLLVAGAVAGFIQPILFKDLKYA